MNIYFLRKGALCLTLICLSLTGAISLADQINPADTESATGEAASSSTQDDLWLQQTKEKCELGNISACSEIGTKFKSLRMSELSWFYYDKACTALHSKSCAELGQMLTKGDGVILDQQAAQYFYGKACDLGDTPSCESIGWNSDRNATCITNDNPEECRKIACEEPDAGHICTVIGINYYNGTHSKGKDDKLAALYFKKACSRKNGTGCLNLGDLYRIGTGVQKDKLKQLQYYAKGCVYESSTACQAIRDWVDKNLIIGEIITK